MSLMNKFLIAATMALALSACKKEAPVEVAPAPVVVEPVAAPAAAPAPAEIMVSAVNLGTAVGADQKVTAATTTFGVNDLIYIAIDTKNASTAAALSYKATYQDGQVVKEDSVSIAPTADTTTNFKLSNPKPWPVGKYKVEVLLNGTAAQSVDFEVK